jgi:hypothetical protein
LAAAVTALSVAAAIVVTLVLTHHTAHHPSALPSGSSTSETASTYAHSGPGVEVFAPVGVDGWTFWVQDWTFAAVYRGRPAGEGRKWVIIDATVTNGAMPSRLFVTRTIVELGNCDGPDHYRVDPTAEQSMGDAVYRTAATHLVKFVFRIPSAVSRMYLRFPPQREEASLDCA